MSELDGEIEINGIQFKRRDLEALRLQAQGLKHSAIASDIGRSVGHVQKVLSNADDERSLFNRINVNGRSQAIRWYVMNVGDPKDPLDDAVRKKRETSARQMEDAEESRPESERL